MADMNLKRLFADAVQEIIDPDTGRVAGIVYLWNTGERRKQWTDRRLETYELRSIDLHDANRTGVKLIDAETACDQPW